MITAAGFFHGDQLQCLQLLHGPGHIHGGELQPLGQIYLPNGLYSRLIDQIQQDQLRRRREPLGSRFDRLHPFLKHYSQKRQINLTARNNKGYPCLDQGFSLSGLQAFEAENNMLRLTG